MNPESSIFSPVKKDYCLYFYYLSVFGFALLIFSLITSIIIGIYKKKGGEFYLQMILLSLGYLIFYFQNRLLYSMCIKSL